LRLIRGCQHVTRTELGYTTTGDDFLIAIAENLVHLQVLSIANAVHLTDRGYFALAARMSPLRKLIMTFTHITDAALTDLVKQGGGSLEHLDVYGCSEISNIGVVAVAKHCPKLVSLNIQGL